jgi:hypothetical protein
MQIKVLCCPGTLPQKCAFTVNYRDPQFQMNLGTLLRKSHDAECLFLSAEAEWQELPCAKTNTKKCKSGGRRGDYIKGMGRRSTCPGKRKTRQMVTKTTLVEMAA